MNAVPRLVEQFSPSNYKLHITPDIKNKTYTGHVVITGDILSPGSIVRLHARDVDVLSGHIGQDSSELSIDSIVPHTDQDMVELHVANQLDIGETSIELHFQGAITKGMLGMYLSTYTEDDETHTIIATQFEADHARECFPCIDEPAAKATFDFTITAPLGLEVLSNTPQKNCETTEQNQTVTFETTPIMSTYLLAWVVGRLESKEKVSEHGVTIRAFATPANVKHVDFALENAAKALDFYDDYFAIPYPLAKLDMIALPDFESGAMENWGLVTYREEALLFDEANTSLRMKYYNVEVVAHELAHQWFGNLVTMGWWDDLWLNEGFATWVSYLATDALYPEWNIWDEFVSGPFMDALEADASSHTHAIVVSIKDPREIEQAFDAISYEKGSSAIRMLHDYLGAKDFKKGLRAYLEQHSYGNTETSDLWHALEQASGKPVVSYMEGWLNQPGYPALKVEQNDTGLKFNQTPFISNPTAQQEDKTERLWPISIKIHNSDQQFVLNEASGHWDFDNPPAPLKLNAGQTGLYRIAYDEDMLTSLTASIKDKSLPAVDRLGIFSDTAETEVAGMSPAGTTLSLLEAYADEDSADVWPEIARGLGMYSFVFGDEIRDLLKPRIYDVTQSLYDKLGWDLVAGESHFDRLLRPTIVGMQAGYDHPDAIKQAAAHFDAEMNGETTNPDIRTIAYTSVAKHNPVYAHEQMFKKYIADDTSAEDKRRLGAGLMSVHDSDKHAESLAMLLDGTVRLQDVIFSIIRGLMNRHNKAQTWEWLVENWDWVYEHFGGGKYFGRLIDYIGSSVTDADYFAKVKAQLATIDDAGVARNIRQALETADTQVQWRERDEAALLKILSSNKN